VIRVDAGNPVVSWNEWQFSTKRKDGVAEVVLYEYRGYDVRTGRWLSRDPIGETSDGGRYGFVRNASLNQLDILGLSSNPYHLEYKTLILEHFSFSHGYSTKFESEDRGGGAATWERFEVKSWIIFPTLRHRASDPAPCCWSLEVQVFGHVMWYASEGHTVHEYGHIGVYRQVYTEMAQFILGYAHSCHSGAEVLCLQKSLNRLVEAYNVYSYIANVRWHVDGGYTPGTPAWRHESEILRIRFEPIMNELRDAKSAFASCVE
jgi:RHS repeat-associated protein